MPSYTQYKRQMAVMDADDANIETWITVKGNHIPIMKGQSKEEAVQAFIEKKGGDRKGLLKASKGKLSEKEKKEPATELVNLWNRIKPKTVRMVKEPAKSQYKSTLSEKEDPTFKQRTEILEKMKGVERGSKEYKSLSKQYMSLFPKPKPHIERKVSPMNELVGAAMGPERPKGEKAAREKSKPAKKEVTYTSELLKTPESQKLYDQIGEYAKRKKDDLDEYQRDHLIALRKILLTDNNATPHVKKNFEKWFGAMPDETESDKDFMKRKLGEWKEKDSVAKKRTELGQAWRNGEMSDKEFAAKSNSITESERYNRPVHIGEAVRNVVKKMGEQRAESKKPAGGSSSGWPESPKFEKLTEKYMPKSGAADNELGEALRSINQAVYRYYNDGDMYNKGYGKETVNAAIKHLTQLSKNKATPRHIARGIDNGLYELKTYGLKDKGRYETALKILLQTFEFADEKDIDALSKMKRNNG